MPYRKFSAQALVDSLSPEQRIELLRVLGTETGRQGGRTAARRMTPEQRSERAKKAAAARWGRSE